MELKTERIEGVERKRTNTRAKWNHSHVCPLWTTASWIHSLHIKGKEEKRWIYTVREKKKKRKENKQKSENLLILFQSIGELCIPTRECNFSCSCNMLKCTNFPCILLFPSFWNRRKQLIIPSNHHWTIQINSKQVGKEDLHTLEWNKHHWTLLGMSPFSTISLCFVLH